MKKRLIGLDKFFLIILKNIIKEEDIMQLYNTLTRKKEEFIPST